MLILQPRAHSANYRLTPFHDGRMRRPKDPLTGETTDTTWIKPLGVDWKEVTYAAIDGLAVFEGCIILGTVEEAKAAKDFVKNNPGITMHGVEQFGVGMEGKQFRWKNNTIPFLIDPALPNQQRVTDAIKHWEEYTPIRFVKHDAANPALPISSSSARERLCFLSRPPRRAAGRDARIAMLDGQLHPRDRPHGRALARAKQGRSRQVRHRQARARDRQRAAQFQPAHPGRQDLGGYDYGSIMHYPRDAFTADGKDTIIPTKPNVEIGQRKKLSAGDIASVKKLITI